MSMGNLFRSQCVLPCTYGDQTIRRDEVDTDVGAGERDADAPGIAHLTVVPENAE